MDMLTTGLDLAGQLSGGADGSASSDLPQYSWGFDPTTQSWGYVLNKAGSQSAAIGRKAGDKLLSYKAPKGDAASMAQEALNHQLNTQVTANAPVAPAAATPVAPAVVSGSGIATALGHGGGGSGNGRDALGGLGGNGTNYTDAEWGAIKQMRDEQGWDNPYDRAGLQSIIGLARSPLKSVYDALTGKPNDQNEALKSYIRSSAALGGDDGGGASAANRAFDGVTGYNANGFDTPGGSDSPNGGAAGADAALGGVTGYNADGFNNSGMESGPSYGNPFGGIAGYNPGGFDNSGGDTSTDSNGASVGAGPASPMGGDPASRGSYSSGSYSSGSDSSGSDSSGSDSTSSGSAPGGGAATGGLAQASRIRHFAAGGPPAGLHAAASLPPRFTRGPGDGQSDDIPVTMSDGGQGRLADNEFVIPADAVSALGSGSSEAGARALYAMVDRIRQAAHGTKQQAKPVNPTKVMPA